MPGGGEAGRAALETIDHIVVVMLENRSFDHMLGYLSLTGGRRDVQGLTREIVRDYPGLHHLTRTRFEPWEDPPHHSGPVRRQIANRRTGFVETFDEAVASRGHPRPPDRAPIVMGYYDGNDLPVYDRLADRFCVCDTWFASVAGPTWPNRCYAVAGESGGFEDNKKQGGLDTPLYYLPAFVRVLPKSSWRWYSAFGHDIDVATVRAVDPMYLWEARQHRENFALFAKRTDQPSFLEDAAAGRLRSVSWIDPNFFTLATTVAMLKRLRKSERLIERLSRLLRFPDRIKNDDHPPGDVRAGQALVRRVVNALMDAKNSAWERTLLIVTYDEHGGFFDHLDPGRRPRDDRPRFRRYGVRVPALIVSPRVERSSSSAVAPKHVFDHTSIVRTVLERFQPDALAAMTTRVRNAASIAELLDADAKTPARRLPRFPELREFEEEFPPERPGAAPRAAPAVLEQVEAAELLVEDASEELTVDAIAPAAGQLDELEEGLLTLLAEQAAARKRPHAG